MLSFGCSRASIDKLWLIPGHDSAVPLNPNPMQKPLVWLCEGFYRQQLYPGQQLDTLQMQFMKNIDRSVSWNYLSAEYVLSSSAKFKRVSLLRWCRHAIVNATTDTFFGDRLLEIEPNLVEKFHEFDENSWKLLYKLPNSLCGDMRAAKKVAVDAITQYFNLPKEKRKGEAWLVRNLEDEMRNAGIDGDDLAKFVTMLYWA